MFVVDGCLCSIFTPPKGPIVLLRRVRVWPKGAEQNKSISWYPRNRCLDPMANSPLLREYTDDHEVENGETKREGIHPKELYTCSQPPP